MKDFTAEKILVVLIIILIVSCAIVCIFLDYHLFGEGEITDKYILSNIAGYPRYYLVLNDEKDIEVSEKTYYEYHIGDYYPKEDD